MGSCRPKSIGFATGLLAGFDRPRRRVGIWGANSHEWVMVQYATAKIGAIMVPINPAYRVRTGVRAQQGGAGQLSAPIVSRAVTISACCASWRRSCRA
ncbi:MAG: AMP-binding protein [Haliea sp.]|nr:AMP-binding protein [Haliea sp.]